MTNSILVIDDDRTVLRLIEKSLIECEIIVHTAGNAEQALMLLEEKSPDVLLIDIKLPGITGLDLARKIREYDSRLPIIFVTASEDSDDAIEAMKLGAYEYLPKPLDKQSVRVIVERALENRRLMRSPVHLPESAPQATKGDSLIGCSPEIREVYKQIGRVAAQDVTVLIRGESGTGKELIARAIYQHSHRNECCFLAVNCAALSDNLLESELFGHEKGAFTGADRRHIGKFEQCHGGTIFLDEIGDMSPSTQAKVLRLLQEQKFERVGGSETITTDVRIISATNCDLEDMIVEGTFRLDLYHRLNAFEIMLPPLRARGEDVHLLLDYFLAQLNTSLHKNITAISAEALDSLLKYSWPGNIRELQSVLRRAMLMATGPVIVPELLPREIIAHPPQIQETSHLKSETNSEAADFSEFLTDRANLDATDLYSESLEWMERLLITRILNMTDGKQSPAAKILGITRGSLRHKIRSLGLAIGHVITSED